MMDRKKGKYNLGMPKPGRLYIVATPIGNPKDITLRAFETLRDVDAVICEELREGLRLLKSVAVDAKAILTLNEHNEKEYASELALRMLNGESFALISDAGTPVFADPGAQLVDLAYSYGIQVVPVPGASSLTATLSCLNIKLDTFYYAGFLPREPDKRRMELFRLKNLKTAIVLLDTPYRLSALLADVQKSFGKNRQCLLALDISLPTELIVQGTLEEVQKMSGGRKFEFVLIVYP
ncbi:MAG TPA: SAM-dependent methyltransferase [Bellilinea sp.]|nr:SAM-dependent methyltransferase [Bellilinea sp.]